MVSVLDVCSALDSYCVCVIEVGMMDELLQRLVLRSINVCPFCSIAFPEGLQKCGKLNTSWLVHCSQTHGFEPEDILYFIAAGR